MSYQKKKTSLFERFFNHYAKEMNKIEKRLNRFMQREMTKIDINQHGDIKPTFANLITLNKIMIAFNKEFEKQIESILKLTANSLNDTIKLNIDYYKEVSETKYDGNIGDQTLRRRLGIDTKGQLRKDGYLGRIITDQETSKEIRRMLETDISNGRNFEATSDKVQDMLISKKTRSVFRNWIDTTIRDTYIQNDRAISNAQADRFGLSHFIYAGTLVEDSRCFCIERVGEAFSVEEAEQWRGLVGMDDCSPIVGIKAESVEEKRANYRPLLDMGGWGCLHIPRYISEKEYKRMRNL